MRPGHSSFRPQHRQHALAHRPVGALGEQLQKSGVDPPPRRAEEPLDAGHLLRRRLADPLEDPVQPLRRHPRAHHQADEAGGTATLASNRCSRSKTRAEPIQVAAFQIGVDDHGQRARQRIVFGDLPREPTGDLE